MALVYLTLKRMKGCALPTPMLLPSSGGGSRSASASTAQFIRRVDVNVMKDWVSDFFLGGGVLTWGAWLRLGEGASS